LVNEEHSIGIPKFYHPSSTTISTDLCSAAHELTDSHARRLQSRVKNRCSWAKKAARTGGRQRQGFYFRFGILVLAPPSEPLCLPAACLATALRKPRTPVLRQAPHPPRHSRDRARWARPDPRFADSFFSSFCGPRTSPTNLEALNDVDPGALLTAGLFLSSGLHSPRGRAISKSKQLAVGARLSQIYVLVLPF
jgi:hypothetical protein